MRKFNLLKKIKSINLKSNNCIFNKKYIILLLIILLGIVTIYVNNSYDFIKVDDLLSKISFFNGTLNYKIENDELVNNSVSIGAGDELELVLNLKSRNWIDSNYELYYLVDGEKNSNENIEIGYSEETVDKVKGVIKARDTKKITVSINYDL